jgi:hypothetical protein
MDEKKEPRMSYKERKAREQLANARDNRKKWENREEESGDKEKLVVTATGGTVLACAEWD